MKKNACILFSGGTYGTFLEWCINYFSDMSFPDDLPFTESGNSHKFTGNHLLNVDGCKQYIDSELNHLIVRFHLRTKQDQLVDKDLKFICKNFNNVIFLYCTYDSMIWSMNNKFEKVWPNGWLHQNAPEIKNSLINWNTIVDPNSMPCWELREFLSLYLYEQHIAESDLNNIDLFKQIAPLANFVAIESLRDNFEATIKNLLKKLDLPIARLNFNEIYCKWMESQYHCYKDITIKNIISAVLNNKDLSWNNLSLVDEAMIQYFLRINGYELKCYNLNIFPTNTIQLRDIIYAT